MDGRNGPREDDNGYVEGAQLGTSSNPKPSLRGAVARSKTLTIQPARFSAKAADRFNLDTVASYIERLDSSRLTESRVLDPSP